MNGDESLASYMGEFVEVQRAPWPFWLVKAIKASGYRINYTDPQSDLTCDSPVKCHIQNDWTGKQVRDGLNSFQSLML